uniref:3-hydroxy-3-methylglutaryl coenzyme A reductase n=1 Tax=uncultured marine thaumarchaeote AD1000_88_E07 TaxID=1455946 RepID=A0A075G594_9ARCH|nr:hydroxymethylglutaryl-CoA reductase, degradative (mvaA) [uncultured marine thaumarchaeote AD1000_88_E07]
MPNSSIPKFFEKSLKERLSVVGNFANLTEQELEILENATGGIDYSHADKMIENAIGTFSLPIGIATNFQINEKDYLIPMVIEEPSVVAASSKAAKIARIHGGFKATAEGNYSIGQIQVVDFQNYHEAVPKIISASSEIIDLANSKSDTLSKLGKGVKEIMCREVPYEVAGKEFDGTTTMLIVELVIDVGDAMGANVTNTMCEAVAPLIEKLSGGRTLLRILSNYSTKRMVTASAVFDKESIGGEKVVDDMIFAFQFANNDTFRAVTHNKGVMNGTISVANATGQDSRAIEAAAHAYAAESGMYRSLTKWKKDDNGNLLGKFELPLSVGIVGGVINDHPVAKISKKILGVSSAQELACIMASVGLAQNFAAMRALVTEGIQKGHMKLHARKQD